MLGNLLGTEYQRNNSNYVTKYHIPLKKSTLEVQTRNENKYSRRESFIKYSTNKKLL